MIDSLNLKITDEIGATGVHYHSVKTLNELREYIKEMTNSPTACSRAALVHMSLFELNSLLNE